MPEVTRRFVHAAWLYFLFGALSGAAFLTYFGLTGMRVPYPLVLSHVHALLVGWAAQWVMGIAFWMYPRPPGTKARPREAQAAFLLLNAGLLLRLLAEPLAIFVSSPLLSTALVLSGLLQAAAAVLFVASIWERIAPPRPDNCGAAPVRPATATTTGNPMAPSNRASVHDAEGSLR